MLKGDHSLEGYRPSDIWRIPA